MEPFAYIFLFQAYKLDMTSATFTWMFPGWYSSNWWTVNDTTCDHTEINEAVNGYIGFDVSPLSDHDASTDVMKV